MKQFRVYAAARDQSMTALMNEAVQAMLDKDRGWELAKRRAMKRMREAPDSGCGEVRNWTRDEIHER